jgi:phosphinothricin acetyltransferase
LFAVLRLQGLKWAVAGATLPNPGSEGLHRAVGFQPVGVYRGIGFKCGAWHDVMWWQLALQDRGSEPAEPLDLDAVRHLPQWADALAAGLGLIRQTHGRSDLIEDHEREADAGTGCL